MCFLNFKKQYINPEFKFLKSTKPTKMRGNFFHLYDGYKNDNFADYKMQFFSDKMHQK